MKTMKIVLSILCSLFVVLWVAANDAAAKPKPPTTGESDFLRIGVEGFGDSANSYSWSVYWFNGNLYVGTNRHHLYSMFEAVSYMTGSTIPISSSDLPAYLQPDPPPSTTWFDPVWAYAFQGEIWRYTAKKKWERVHQSDVFPMDSSKTKWAPVAYGYRAMAEFNGYLYACGIGTWMPPVANDTIVRSATGDPNTWEDVSGIIAGTTNIRAITTWNNRLYVAASVASTPTSSGGAVVFEFAESMPQRWKQVSAPGFGTPDNSEIYYLTVFDNHLYASTVNLVTGFEVWKGALDPDNPGQYVWTRVIRNGFGDTWVQYGMTMAPFGDYLYVGTAVGIGMVMKNNADTGQPEVVGTRAFDIIRIDKSDNAELIVGGEALDPIEGGPTSRTPASGMGSGFNNPFNVYAWNMNVYKGCLYTGTLDIGLFIMGMLEEHPEYLSLILNMYTPDLPTYIVDALNANLPEALKLMEQLFPRGGDLWKSCDGVNWTSVTTNGFGNQYNYGIREVIPVMLNGTDAALAVGTANPFTGRPKGGAEVWVGGKLPLK